MTRAMFFCLAAASLLASAVCRVGLALSRAISFAIEAVARPLAPDISAGFAPAGSPFMAPVSPSLFNSNRHESSVSRRSADRNI